MSSSNPRIERISTRSNWRKKDFPGGRLVRRILQMSRRMKPIAFGIHPEILSMANLPMIVQYGLNIGEGGFCVNRNWGVAEFECSDPHNRTEIVIRDLEFCGMESSFGLCNTSVLNGEPVIGIGVSNRCACF